MKKAKFTALRRKTPFLCVGYGKPHESKGRPHTMHGNGPYCGHCAAAIYGPELDEITGLPLTEELK